MGTLIMNVPRIPKLPLETERESRLAGEELRNHHRGRRDESVGRPEGRRADVVHVVAAKIGPVGQIERLEEDADPLSQ